MRSLSLVLAAALAASGCAYTHDRARDLAQVADLSLGWSEGIEANVRATKLLQVGLGSYRGPYWFGLKDGVLDVWQEERSELGVSLLHVHEYHRSEGHRLLDVRQPLFGDPGHRQVSWDVTHLTDRGFFDLGITLNPILVGADAALSPAQVLDFVAGLATLDPLEDDVHGPSLETLGVRLSGDSARVRANAARALRLRTGEDFGYVVSTAPSATPADQVRAVRLWREYLQEHGVGTPPELAPAAEAPPDEDASE